MEKTLNDCRTEKKMLDACLSSITKILENNGFFIKQNRRELCPFARNLADACMDIETALFYLRGDEDRIEQAGECRLADFGEIVYVHDDDGRIRIVRNGIEGGVYVNYCGGCGKKSSKPIEQI
jgi:hypothetical protein